MEQLVRGIEHSLVLLAVGLPILGGAWGLRLVNVSPLRDRQDRRSAFRLAVAMALLAGAFVGYLTAELSGLRVCGLFVWCDTGPDYGVGIVSGVATGTVLFLGEMAGYATLARVRTGSVTLTGVVLGPLVLVGGPLLLASIAAGPLQDAVRDHEDRDRAAARASAIHLSISELDVRTTPEGVVDAVDLVLIVQSERYVEVGWPGNSLHPGFELCPRRDCSYANSATEILWGVISDDGQWPAVLEAGSMTSLSMRFEPRGEGTAPPGSWHLEITCSDGSEPFVLEMTVELSTTR